MTDEEFEQFVAASNQELFSKQAKFQELIAGEPDWNYDLDTCSLRVGKQQFEITPIGTFCQEYQSWLWAWANEDFPDSARKAAEKLLGLYKLTGYRIFMDPGAPATMGDAQIFAALALNILDARGLFKTADGDPTLFLAVH